MGSCWMTQSLIVLYYIIRFPSALKFSALFPPSVLFVSLFPSKISAMQYFDGIGSQSEASRTRIGSSCLLQLQTYFFACFVSFFS